MSTDITGFWGEEDMSALAGNYSEGGKTLPPDWHNSVIKSTELKPTREGSGTNLFVYFLFGDIEKKKCFNLKKSDGTVNEYTGQNLQNLPFLPVSKGC